MTLVACREPTVLNGEALVTSVFVHQFRKQLIRKIACEDFYLVIVGDMSTEEERSVLREFLEVYSDHPCLWDIGSEQYRDKSKRARAWSLMAQKLQEMDPEADIATAKRRIVYMRTACQREIKKVLKAKEANMIHYPHLWYYSLLSPLLDKNCDLSADEEPQNNNQSIKIESTPRKKFTPNQILYRKKRKSIDATQHVLQQQQQQKSRNTNSFGIYVGEELEKLNTFQRQVAEKLIAEVLFLAKTENLGFESKIENVSRSQPSLSCNSCSLTSQPQLSPQSDPLPDETTSPPEFKEQSSSPQYKDPDPLLKGYLIEKKI